MSYIGLRVHQNQNSVLATLNNIWGTYVLLKNSSANGDAPLKKTWPRKRFVLELQTESQAA